MSLTLVPFFCPGLLPPPSILISLLRREFSYFRLLSPPAADTAVPPDAGATLNRALNDYIDFVRAIADSPTDALRAKVEAELGAKVLQLRAVPSVSDSEERRNVPVAGDHILTDHVATSVMDVSGRRARRAAASATQA